MYEESLQKVGQMDWLDNRISNLKSRTNCGASKNTKLFDVVLLCADRTELRKAIKLAGALVKSEDLNNWGDSYSTSNILNESSTLSVVYTHDDLFAQAKYIFPSRMDSQQIVRIRDLLTNKYGKHDSTHGKVNLGEVYFKWHQENGIDVEVSRGWPDTTTILTYTHLLNFKEMKDEQNKQLKEREAEKYQSQSNAF